VFYILPGVPREMRKMWTEVLRPKLVEHGYAAMASHCLQVIGCREATLGEKLAPFMASELDPRVGITARAHEFHRHDRVVDVGKQPPHTRPRPVEVADDGSAQITGTAHGCKRLLREVAVDQQHGLGADDREIEGRGHRFDATAVGHDEAALTAAPIHQDHSHRGGNPRTPQQSSGFDPCIS